MSVVFEGDSKLVLEIFKKRRKNLFWVFKAAEARIANSKSLEDVVFFDSAEFRFEKFTESREFNEKSFRLERPD